MSPIAFEIITVLLLILANGIFVISEMSIVSARKTRLQELAERGDQRARVALDVANSPNRFLSTVQVGITLIGILTGVFGGATIANSLQRFLTELPVIGPYSQPISLGIVVLIITYLTLIVGELVPKRLALNSPERIAITIAGPMRVLSAIAYPVVHLLSSSTEAVLGLMGVAHRDEPLVTEEEIKVMVRQGAEAGMFEAAEQDMVERVFHLGDQRVGALMTPRLDIVWLDLNDSEELNRRKIIENGHSRYPVCQETIDHVLGVVHVTDLLSRNLSNQPFEIASSLREPLFIPESSSALKVLEMFKQSSTHVALVVDEYGVIQGIVTLNDVMEVVIGDVPFADDHDFESPIIRRDDGSWLLDGMVPVDKLKEVFDLEELPGEERGNFHTLGGFVITQLGRIPNSAEHFEWGGFRFEVVDMDGNRVDKMLVIPLSRDGSTP